MFTWLNPRPASFRRAARPATKVVETAVAVAQIVDVVPVPGFVESELDVTVRSQPLASDQAVAALSEAPTREMETPPPLSLFDTLEARLEALPPFPETGSADRTAQLLDILRTLDRIAGDVVAALDAESDDATDASLPRKPR